MGEKYRNIDRTPWRDVIDRDYAFCECPELCGYASLIHFLDIKSSMRCTYSDGVPVVIIEKGYFWLQFAPENENFWLTALIDKHGNFDHAYFDMTEYNVIDGENSFFCDLYLDVAIKKNGDVFILDEDELTDALTRGEISADQFKKAKLTAECVSSRFGGDNTKKMISLCDKYFNKLYPMLTDRKTINMNLQREPFEAVKNGKKTIELRLYDEKRRNISVGDQIEFEHGGEVICVKVIDLYRADTFFELFSRFPMNEMGFESGTTVSDGVESMRGYYSEQKEKEYGVIGIKIKKT